MDAVDPDAVRHTIANLESVSGKAEGIASDVSKVTTRLAEHAGDVDKVMSDATEIADRLNHASVRVDGILEKVDALLGSGDTKGLVTEASETLKSFKQVADTLNSAARHHHRRPRPLLQPGPARGRGLRADGRRSIDRIEEAVSDFQRNPQRILSGGDGTVREFSGRARR